MHRILIALLALLTLIGTSYGSPRKRSSHGSKRPVTAKSSKTGSKTASNTTKSRYRRSTSSYGGRSYAHRSSQAVPSPERYREIQQALADKGYFKGAVNGEWGPESVDALRRFQADQNLDVDGKIGSLSLIAMGLGPKRVTAQAKPVQPAVQPNPPAQSKQP